MRRDTRRMPRPATRADLALLLLLATLWASSYPLIKIGVATIPPVTLIAVRTLLAAGLLLVLLRTRGISMPRAPADWRGFLFQGCLNSILPFTLLAWGQLTTDAGLAAILNSTSPIFVFLLTVSVTRHEAMGARQLFGVSAGLAGVCLIVGVQALEGLGRELLAQAAIVAATVCYAFAALYGRRFAALDPMVPAAGSLLCGAFVLLPVSLLVDRPWTLTPAASSLAALVGLSVFSTALALTVYFRLVQTIGPLATTAQAYLRVPIAVAISVLLLGETLAPTTWAGLVCVVAGVAAMVGFSSRRN
jgi:drug/metabolite transporter (DMT)-like permease